MHSFPLVYSRVCVVRTQTHEGEDDLKKGTQLLEVYALEIQMYTSQKNNKKLKVELLLLDGLLDCPLMLSAVCALCLTCRLCTSSRSTSDLQSLTHRLWALFAVRSHSCIHCVYCELFPGINVVLFSLYIGLVFF